MGIYAYLCLTFSESGQIWLLATTSKKNAKTAPPPSPRGLTLHPALAFMVKAANFFATFGL